MIRFNNESYNSFYGLGGSELKSTGRHSSDEGGCANSHWVIMVKESRKENARTFFCKPNQLSNECPHVICTLKLHEFDVDALEKRNLCVAPSPRKDVPKKSKKAPKSLPSKQPLDYISPVFYSDYTSVTLFTYIRISSHPTTALISRHYFCRLFCHQETIHLLASRSAIVKPWSWALAGDSNSGSTNLIKKPTGLFNCHGGWWIQQTQRE